MPHDFSIPTSGSWTTAELRVVCRNPAFKKSVPQLHHSMQSDVQAYFRQLSGNMDTHGQYWHFSVN